MTVDMFIKIGDIKGESRDSQHKDEIDVVSWGWGMAQSGSMHSGGGGGSGKVEIEDLDFTKMVDKSSPNLMKICCTGQVMKDAVLTVRKAGGKSLEYVSLKMHDVIVSSVNTGGSGGEDRLTEKIKLNFSKVRFEYQPQKDDGSKDGGAIPMDWNMKTNAEK